MADAVADLDTVRELLFCVESIPTEEYVTLSKQLRHDQRKLRDELRELLEFLEAADERGKALDRVSQQHEQRKQVVISRRAMERYAAAKNAQRLALVARRRAERVRTEMNPLCGETAFIRAVHRKRANPRTNGIAGGNRLSGKGYAPIINDVRIDHCDRNACVRVRSSCARRPASSCPSRTHRTPHVSHVGSCGACGRPASCRCGGCRSVLYCGQLCQKADWTNHMLACPRTSEIRRTGRNEAEPSSAAFTSESVAVRDSVDQSQRAIAAAQVLALSSIFRSILPLTLLAVFVNVVSWARTHLRDCAQRWRLSRFFRSLTAGVILVPHSPLHSLRR